MRLWFATCVLYRHIHYGGQNHPPALGAPTVTYRICHFIKNRGISSVWLPCKLFSTDFSKAFSRLGSGTTFTLLFVQHLPCWSRESTLVNTPTPICSFLFLFTFLRFALLRSMSRDNTRGLCQCGPKSKLSPGENPPPDWQERAPKHPCCYFPPNMRVSSVKASLETWPGGHSAKRKHHGYFQIVLISSMAKTLEFGNAWLSALSCLLYRLYSFYDHQRIHVSYMLIIYVHPSLGKDVSMYLTDIPLYAVILAHVRDPAEATSPSPCFSSAHPAVTLNNARCFSWGISLSSITNQQHLHGRGNLCSTSHKVRLSICVQMQKGRWFGKYFGRV